jgi:glutathione S-transferase
MIETILTISSKNYSSWSLRGWLLCRIAGLEFVEEVVPADDPANRAELLLLSPSILVPCLTHEGTRIWDTLAIAEYLNEVKPKAGLLPADRAARAHCRSICGEIHSGFTNLRSALPMNLKAHRPDFKIWAGAQADIDRITTIWRECLAAYHGPYLFGNLTMADAMYAPVVTRFLTYDVKLDAECTAYCDRIMALPEMIAWRDAAVLEPEELEELDMEF